MKREGVAPSSTHSDDTSLPNSRAHFAVAAGSQTHLWDTFYSPDGRPYYVHRETGETVWSIPDDDSQRVWLRFLSPNGAYYFFNSVSQESVWSEPDSETAQLSIREYKEWVKRRDAEDIRGDIKQNNSGKGGSAKKEEVGAERREDEKERRERINNGVQEPAIMAEEKQPTHTPQPQDPSGLERVEHMSDNHDMVETEKKGKDKKRGEVEEKYEEEEVHQTPPNHAPSSTTPIDLSETLSEKEKDDTFIQLMVDKVCILFPLTLFVSFNILYFCSCACLSLSLPLHQRSTPTCPRAHAPHSPPPLSPPTSFTEC